MGRMAVGPSAVKGAVGNGVDQRRARFWSGEYKYTTILISIIRHWFVVSGQELLDKPR
jgi:hypothetical protein